MNTAYLIFEQTLLRGIEAHFADVAGGRTAVLEVPPEPSPEPSVIAAIGFGGEGVRGTVTTLVSRAGARWLRPAGVHGGEDSFDCDVLGEITNMLVGRMKNQLLGHGVALQFGTPTVIIGRDVRVHASEAAVSTWHTVEVEQEHRLCVRLDVSLAEGFAFAGEGAGPSSVGVEGTMLLF